MNGLRLLKPRTIVGAAILISVLAHFYLFFGFPSFLFSKATPLEENFVAELRVEPVKKVQLSKPSAPEPSVQDLQSNAVGDGAKIEEAVNGGGQGGEQAGQPFRVPDPGIYYYDAYLDGQYLQTASIEWQFDPALGYRLFINIPYAFVGPFIFESRGKIDAYGLAPDFYVEHVGSRPARFTRFDRDHQGGGKMFFSQKPDEIKEIPPGTQDRFSLMMQLASLLGGDDSIDEKGTVREIPIANLDTLEIWRFQSQGEELSDAVFTMGPMVLRHYKRLPVKEMDKKRRNDIWLIKDFGWIPGRVRLENEKGRTFELFFKQVDPIAALPQ
jgi:hypothetical protein